MPAVSGTADKRGEGNMADEWSGKLSSLRISPGAYPELFAALEKVPAKDRAERLRSLATLGLIAVRGGGIGVSVELPAGEGGKGEGNRQAGKKEALKGKLLQSL